MSENRLFNNKEAAHYLGIKSNTLTVWRSTKKVRIPYVKVGGKIQYTKEALDKFIENNEVI